MHSLRGGKGFGNDNDQGLFRVEAGGLFFEVGPVNVGDKDQVHPRLGVRAQGHGKIFRPQIRAANPDRNDILKLLAGYARSLAGEDFAGEAFNLAQDLVDPRHHIQAVHHDKAGAHGMLFKVQTIYNF